MYWRGRMAEDDRDYGMARAYYLKLSERYKQLLLWRAGAQTPGDDGRQRQR